MVYAAAEGKPAAWGKPATWGPASWLDAWGGFRGPQLGRVKLYIHSMNIKHQVVPEARSSHSLDHSLA